MITLLKPLKWSPDGCRIEIIEAGEHEELPARAIEIAGQIGILDIEEPSGDIDPPPTPPPEPGPVVEIDPVVDEKPQKNSKK
ncbi:hypothetical protein AAHD62_04750 [Enterobacter hormaechei]